VPVGPTRTSTLALCADRVRWDDRSVELSEAVDVRYATRSETTSFWQQRLVRRVLIQGPRDSIDIALGREIVSDSATRAQADAYMCLVEHLHATLEPRLRRKALSRIVQGGTVTCGPLALSEEGIHVSGDRRRRPVMIGWHRLPAAHFEHDSVQVVADGSAGATVLAEVSMLAPHAVILPELVEEAIARFC
jgi:hypothetical protein